MLDLATILNLEIATTLSAVQLLGITPELEAHGRHIIAAVTLMEPINLVTHGLMTEIAEPIETVTENHVLAKAHQDTATKKIFKIRRITK